MRVRGFVGGATLGLSVALASWALGQIASYPPGVSQQALDAVAATVPQPSNAVATQ